MWPAQNSAVISSTLILAFNDVGGGGESAKTMEWGWHGLRLTRQNHRNDYPIQILKRNHLAHYFQYALSYVFNAVKFEMADFCNLILFRFHHSISRFSLICVSNSVGI